VVHHAPVAMWPGSSVVFLRWIVAVWLVKVTVACVYGRKPHVWGFHCCLFSCSESDRSPSVFMMVVRACFVVNALDIRGRTVRMMRMMGRASMRFCMVVFSCLCVELLWGCT